METATLDYKNAKGWLLPEEADLLFKLAGDLWQDEDATILNIGVEYGKSLVCLRAGNPVATIYASDIEWSKCIFDDPSIIRLGDSHELIKTWDKRLDLIFVDGDHGYEGVLLDAKFADFLTIGNYILFQDCYDHDAIGEIHKLVPGVNQAVSEWFATHNSKNNYECGFKERPYVGSTRIFQRIF